MTTGMRAVVLWGIALAGVAVAVAAQTPIDSCVARFYERRGPRPAWIDANGPGRRALQLLAVAAQARNEGLEPANYVTPALDSLLRRPLVAGDLWRLDSLLTRAFFAYGWDVSRGRVEPELVHSHWTAAPRVTDLVGLLSSALDYGEVTATLRRLAPEQSGYAALRRALAMYRALAARGDWPAMLPQRLEAEGYDLGAGVDAAVRTFQSRHGLATDGVVGPATDAALNVPAAERARQIALNLERWRWLPRSLGERYIIVNSAAFALDVVENDVTVLTMRAIVGRPDWPTPIASSRATDLVFRPVWNVPRTIAAQELLPLLQVHPAYAARQRIRVFTGSPPERTEVDPGTIDWGAITETDFPYQLAQEPGPANPLGGVKLVFRTPFTVFIHDTPTPRLFSERWRAFSHGCVRVEGAGDLAAYLLPEWPADSIRSAMTTGRERWVRVASPIPVHLVYWTAWVNGDGTVEFRDDTYAWDEHLAAALHREDSRPAQASFMLGGTH